MFKKLKSFFSCFKLKKYPSRKQWRRFFRVLDRREKIIFLVFLGMFLASSLELCLNFYFKNTEVRPAEGGIFIEGVIGQPRFINPVYSWLSDIDQDLTELIFSGLMKYDGQGNIVPDLTQKYEIKEEGKVYEIELKENLFWQDSQPLTADDVIFTIKTIQNSDYKSPQIASWLGVEVEKISDSAVRFKLKNPYGSFLENLTQKIIPAHIWEDVPAQNFPLSIYNLKPVGSGPYKLKSFNQDKEGQITFLYLVRNPKYFGKTPYLSQITFRFFKNEGDLIKGYKKGEIKGFFLKDLANFSELNNLDNPVRDLSLRGARIYSFSLPRYFALFLNPEKSKVLADQNIRFALNYGTNKSEIIEKVLLGYGKIVQSPILPEIYGFQPPTTHYEFNPGRTKEILEKAGFIEREGDVLARVIEKKPAFQFKADVKEGSKGKEVENLQRCLAKDPEIYPEGEITGLFGKATRQAVIRFQEKYRQEILEKSGLKQGTGIVSKATREKLNELCFPSGQELVTLKFSLTTVNQPVLIKVAEILKEQWRNLGIELEIKTFDISQLEKGVLRQREYEILLFGEVLTIIPDPFPFWHSNQIKDPGLNLALYQNKKVDKLLEEARQTLDESERKEKLEKFQNLLIEDSPVVFLYNPDYLYFVAEEAKGLNGGFITSPSKRFNNIENWYVKTRRVWK